MTHDIQPVEENLDQQNPVEQATKEDFYQALSLIEQFYELKDSFSELQKALPPNHQQEMNGLIEQFNSLLEVLDSESSPVEVVQNQQLSGWLPRSKIERLGIAGELIRLRKEQRPSLRELAKQFEVSEATISRFFRYYDALNPSEKSKYQRKSIFEITERLEELQTYILQNFKRLEGVRDEVAVKYIGEFNKALELAVKVADKINEEKRVRQEWEKFKQDVYEILSQELPERRGEILKKIKESQGGLSESSIQ